MAALKMQILCWISIWLISHGSSLNLNRPSSRWARSDDSSDGWKASNGPYFSSDPVSFAASTSTTLAPMSTTPRAIPARKVDEGSSFLAATSPEGFYELVVGKKSPMSETMGASGGSSTGSPDVIIGRVMSTTGVIESVPTTTTASVVGHSSNGFVEEKAQERSDDDDLIEMESRSSETFIRKNPDFHPILPPGSFFLPAVSRKADQYYSDSEQAIYIPLRRPDQSSPAFPVRTSVVLVNNQKQQQQQPPVIPSYNSKEGDEEEEEEETVDQDEDNQDDVDDSVPPTKSHSSALDLVMTLYPNLPKLMSPSLFTSSQGIKNLLKTAKLPPGSAGATSVIHEAKVVTPPQGYLPQLPVKTIGNNNNKPNFNHHIAHHKPAAANSVTQLTRSPTNNNYAPDQRHHPTATGSSSFSKTTIQFTPFTPDDISPLNFLLPAPGSLSQLDKVTAITDQPDTPRSNYGSTLAPPNGDLIADAAQNTAGPLRIVPAPKLDFSWNLYQPPSQVSQQASESPIFGSREQEKSQQEQQTKPESSGHLLVPGQTGEIVVRTQMATGDGQSANRPGTSDSVDIITSYYDEDLASSNQKAWLANHVPDLPILLPTLSVETATTLPPIATEQVVATTTVSSQDAEPASIPKLHGNFQPMVGKFPHHSEPPQDRSHHPELVSEEVPLVTPTIHAVKDEDDDVFSAPRVTDIVDDQHAAGSQIHETSVYEENLPRVLPIKSANTEGQGKSSTPHYKTGKMSPKGAMYTVTQGHSKVKFFGFNALHNGELKPIDGKFFIFQPHQDQQEPEWKFSPYLPVRLSAAVNPAFKLVPKKSIPISAGKKSGSIRPVFFAKRPDGQSLDTPWSGSSVISEPFEYHAHLQKMADQEQGRLPISQSSA